MSQLPVELDPEPMLTIRASEFTTPTIINMAIYYYKINGACAEELHKLITLEKEIDDWRERNPDKIFKLGVNNV